jgi:glutamyl-Q tRNA(Asp) synthetase
MGRVCQHLALEVGDFVLKRADGFWAYQLAVVVDDGAQDITHVVRGADLIESTPRQIHLQQLLGLSTPAYMHVPLVTNEAGKKLSKQTRAMPIDLQNPLAALKAAAAFLGIDVGTSGSIAEFWSLAVNAWARRFVLG